MLALTPTAHDAVLLLLDPSLDPNTPLYELFANGPLHAKINGKTGSHVVMVLATPQATAFRLDLGGVEPVTRVFDPALSLAQACNDSLILPWNIQTTQPQHAVRDRLR